MITLRGYNYGEMIDLEIEIDEYELAEQLLKLGYILIKKE